MFDRPLLFEGEMVIESTAELPALRTDIEKYFREPAVLGSSIVTCPVIKDKFDNDAAAGLIATAKRTAGEAKIAGLLKTSGEIFEYFDEEIFVDTMNMYASKSIQLADAGADILILDDMSGLIEARAGLLGARQTKKPVLAFIKAGGDGRAVFGDNFLSCMLCLSRLGAAGFGISIDSKTEIEGELISLFKKYGSIPLMLKIDTAGFSSGNIIDRIRPFYENGFSIFWLTGKNSKELYSTVREYLAGSINCTGAVMEDSPILLCDRFTVYHLEEDFNLTDPVKCQLDMSDEILSIQASGDDILLFDVNTSDDAKNFYRNVHLVSTGVGIISDNESAMEEALIHYNGCALIYSRSDIPEEHQRGLALGYGAIIR